MSWVDDLRARAEESLNAVSGDVQEYFKARITDAVVKAGEPPKGNLSAAQIAQGQTGAPPASQQLAPVSAGFSKYLPVIAVGALAYFAFSGKGK